MSENNQNTSDSEDETHSKPSKEELNKKIDDMILLGEIDRKEDLFKNQEKLERLSKQYPDLSSSEVKEILGVEEEEVVIKTKLPKLPHDSNEIQLYKPKYELMNPDISERTRAISNAEKMQDKSLLIDMIPSDIFIKNVIPNIEKMVTENHLIKIKHAKGGSTPYLTALVAKDIISTYMNIRMSIDTLTYVVPVLGDVKVRCSVTVIDANRNVFIDGIIAEEYLLKRRGIDPDTNSEILIYGDESTVEKCQTRAVRRAIEYILPPFVMDKIEEIALQKIKEAEANKKKMTKKPDK